MNRDVSFLLTPIFPCSPSPHPMSPLSQGSSRTPKSPANPASEEKIPARIYLAGKRFKTAGKGSSPAAGPCLDQQVPAPHAVCSMVPVGYLQNLEMSCVTAAHQDPLQGTSQPGSPFPAQPHGPQTPETSTNDLRDNFPAFPLNFISSLEGG